MDGCGDHHCNPTFSRATWATCLENLQIQEESSGDTQLSRVGLCCKYQVKMRRLYVEFF